MNVPINRNVHQKPPQFLTKSHHYLSTKCHRNPWPNATRNLGQKGPCSMTTPVLITKGHTTLDQKPPQHKWPIATTTLDQRPPQQFMKSHLNQWPSQLMTKSNHNSWSKATTSLLLLLIYFLTGWNSTYCGKKWRYLWRCSKSSLPKGEKWLPLLFDSI